MGVFSSPSIVMRRVDYGDYDVILTLFTLDQGKLTAIAKYAKKSRKRFPGVLELFSFIQALFSSGKGMPVLQEAELEEPFANIRNDIVKTAYASFWSDVLASWLEEGQRQEKLFYLLKNSLNALDQGAIPPGELSLQFLMRFLALSGLSPVLGECSVCGCPLDEMDGTDVVFEFPKGGIVCPDCASSTPMRKVMSKGTVKQLLWIQKKDAYQAGRLRFTRSALYQGLTVFEQFAGFHIGRDLKSLNFLNEIR